MNFCSLIKVDSQLSTKYQQKTTSMVVICDIHIYRIRYQGQMALTGAKMQINSASIKIARCDTKCMHG